MSNEAKLQPIFSPNSPLELSLGLLHDVKIRQCDDILRRFLIEFQSKVQAKIVAYVEKMKKFTDLRDDEVYESLSTIIDIESLLHNCLLRKTDNKDFNLFKLDFRLDLIEIWKSLDFTNVSESFVKWEHEHRAAKLAQQDRLAVAAKIEIAMTTIEALKTGFNEESVKTFVEMLFNKTN